MKKIIPTLNRCTNKTGCVSINTIIECHNNGSQLCLSALKDDTYLVRWHYHDMGFESFISAEHFAYLCTQQNADVWFDFELDECKDLDEMQQIFPLVDHI